MNFDINVILDPLISWALIFILCSIDIKCEPSKQKPVVDVVFFLYTNNTAFLNISSKLRYCLHIPTYVLHTIWDIYVGLGILIITRRFRPVWPVARQMRIKRFQKFDMRVWVRVVINLSGADADQPNMSRRYPPTRKFKKRKILKNEFLFKKLFFSRKKIFYF